MNCYLYRIALLFVVLLNQPSTQYCEAQSYGLGFNSHEVITDQRTSLDLFPKGFQTRQSFEISFDLAFLPNKIDYFGYIFRIIENGDRNFDLVYNNRDVTSGPPGRNRFKLVIGEKYSNIDFAVTPNQLFYRWNQIQLKFNYQTKSVVLVVNGKRFNQANISFKPENVYRVIFGRSDEPNFKASDCSAFKLRNVKIYTNDGLKFNWPLDEAAGNTAHEEVSGSTAKIVNPLWIRGGHSFWHPEGTVHVKGISSATFDPLKENLYITGEDSLWTISSKGFVQTATAYQQEKFNLMPSNETIFNPYNRLLYNYYIDKTNKKVSVYDPTRQQWTPNPSFSPAIDFWQTNNFFSRADSSLYVIGGYGRMTYKNTVFRYSLQDQQWEELKTKGYFYCPRYLSACGTTNNGATAYLLGGYGSHTGEQMLNAKNLYDLVKFDVKTRTFTKIYELAVPGDGFVFANTMVINEKTRAYYALIFSNQKFNSELRLLCGSLDKPEYHIVGSAIPFAFHDTHSFAKLFYSEGPKQLIAVTMYRSANRDHDSYYHFYSLLSPPEAIISAPSDNVPKRSLWLLIVTIVGLSVIGFLLYLMYNKRRKTALVSNESSIYQEPQLTIPVTPPGETAPSIKLPAIYLFGNLTILDETGADLTGQFTSLVRELFVVIIIYSLKSARGISPEKLIELLWPDKSEESARNNRSANISKLKSILSHMNHVRISKETGNWRIEIDYQQVHVDYWEYLQIMRHAKTPSKAQIWQLISITQRGSFVASTDYPWLDQIKTDIGNETIDIYLKYLTEFRPEDEPEFAIELANAIFVFDPVNEDAMIAKCRALAFLGKHSLARSTFDAFNKEFKDLYGEDFKTNFTAIVNHLTPSR